MKLTITGRKFHVTDDLTKRITTKLSKLDKFFDDEATANVVLRSRKEQEIIEITIFAASTMFRAEVEDQTVLNALDKAVDIIERQIRKNKTRLEKRLKPGSFDKASLAEAQWNDVQEEVIRITRNKQIPVRLMSPEEAVMQMNLLGHDFFLFLHEHTGTPCVVYKKKNDEYGIIEAVTD